MIDEGVALVSAVLDRAPIGPYQLQAAIAAVHDEADSKQGSYVLPVKKAVRTAFFTGST